MNRNLLISAVVIVLVILVGWGVVRSRSRTSQQSAVVTEKETIVPSAAPQLNDATSTVSATEGAVQEFTVEGNNFKFAPDTLTVKKGQPLRIIFKNIQGFHDFVVNGLDVKTKQIPVGQTDTVEFTPDKAGTFEFYCSVGQHRQIGMKGTLVVE